MANSKSAAKRARIAKKREKRNKKVKDKIKDTIKRFEAAIEDEDTGLAEEELNNAKKIIDKAVSKNIFHENKAARKKSKLDRKFNKLVG